MGKDSEHLPDELLAKYALGKLLAQDSKTVESHIETCDSCRETLATIEDDTFIGVLKDASSGDDLLDAGVTPHLSDIFDATELGDFRIIRPIGKGGMGCVYEAEQISLSRRVALKVLMTGGQLGDISVERFRREAQAAARLHHPNIVPIYDVDSDGNRHFFAMQFIDGSSLAAVIKRMREIREGEGQASAGLQTAVADLQQHRTDDSLNATSSDLSSSSESSSSPALSTSPANSSESDGLRPFSGEFLHDVARLFIDVADALEYAHQQGIIHRDVKPGNLLLGNDGRIWVADFGLAKIDDSDLTGTHDLLGTLRYMPPESYLGDASPQSDLFGLGLTLYELIALRPAYDAMDRKTLIRQVSTGTVRPLAEVAGVPPDLETIVMKLLRPDPSDRYGSAGEVRDDLARFVDGRPIRARPVTKIERGVRWCQRNRLTAALAATSLGLLLAVAIVSSLGYLSATRKSKTIRQNLYAAQMVDASRILADAAGLKRIRGLVDQWRADEDLVGWEWHYLNSLLNRDVGKLRGHDGRVYSVSWNAQGDRLLSAGEDGKVIVWDPTTEHPEQVFHEHTGSVRGAFWSPDATRIASSGNDGAIVVRQLVGESLDDENAVIRFQDESPVNTFAWSPDGTTIAAGYVDGQVVVWNVATGEKTILGQHTNSVIQLDWHPDGTHIVSSGVHEPLDHQIAFKIWDIASGNHTDVPSIVDSQPRHSESVYALRYSHDKRIVSADLNGSVVLWNENGEPISVENDVHNGLIGCVRWLTENRLVTASRDRTVRVRDFQQDQVISVFRGHEGTVNWVDVHPNSKSIASASSDGTIRLWNLKTNPEPFIRFERRGFSWDPDSVSFISSDPTGRMVFDSLDPNASSTLGYQAEHGKIALDWSPDGKQIATVCNGEVRIEDCETKESRTFPIATELNPASWIEWAPNMQRLLISGGGKKNNIQIYDAQSGELVHKMAGRTTGYAASWSPDSKSVAGVSFLTDAETVDTPDPRRRRLGKVAIWDASTGEVIWRVPATDINGLAWHPSGDLLATVGDSEVVEIWNVVEQTKECELPGNRGALYAVAWSPDGTRLAASDANSNIKIWDPERQLELLNLPIPEKGIPIYLEWSPDGRKLGLWTWGNHIHIFDATPGY